MSERVELGNPKASLAYCSDCSRDALCPVEIFSKAFDGWKPGMSTRSLAEKSGLKFEKHITPPLSDDNGPYDIYTCTKAEGKIIPGEVKIYQKPLTLVTDSWSAPE